MGSEYRTTSSGTMDNLLSDLGLITSDGQKASPKKKPPATKSAVVLPAEVVSDASMQTIRETLGRIIGDPHAPDMLEVGMACVVDARLRESTDPDWTGVVGPPGCGKTEVIQACRGEHTLSLDTLASAASFLSGARDQQGKKATPFLEEANGRAVLMKDMSALLSDDPKKARAILGTLTNIFDGEYSKAVGTAFEGSALQQSQSRFSLFFGATVSTWLEHSQTVEKTGARCLMYLVPTRAKSEDEADFTRARDPRKREYRNTLKAQVEACVKQVIADKAPVTIPDAVDEWLQQCSHFIAAGRTPIRSEQITVHDDHNNIDRRQYVENPGETEKPFRAYQQLRGKLINLCRVNGHAQPTAHELRIIRHLTLSTVTLKRAQIIVAMADRESFTIGDVITETGLTPDAVVYRIATMKAVGLLEQGEMNARGAGVYRIASRFQALRHLPKVAS